METRRRVGKSAALVSSIVLVGGFITFCSGAVFMLGSKSSSVFSFVTPKSPVPPPEAPAPAQEPPKYMSGSKSTFIFVGTGVKPPDAPAPAEQKPPAKGDPVPEPPR